MKMWTSRAEHSVRRVSERAILDKLQECADAGINLDRIPLNISVGDLLRMPVVEIAALAGGSECPK